MTRQTWRAIRELLMCMYRHLPGSEAYPVYYVDAGPPDLMETANAVKSLHLLPLLPWPESPCIIIGDAGWISTVVNPDYAHRIFVCVAKSANDYMLEGTAHPSYLYVAANIDTVSWRAEPMPHSMLIYNQASTRDHPQGDASEYDFDADIIYSVDAHRRIAEGAGCAKYNGSWLERYYRRCMPGTENFWRLADIPKDEFERGGFALTGRFTDACEFLATFSALAMPCHYFVQASHDGFGTSSMRRRTREKPLICIVPYDRLYRLYGGDHTHEVAPHFRRGHIRHLWKAAGLNRFALPDDPGERLKLVFRHRVQRVYVHPAWVGDLQFERDGIRYEVQTGERQLN